MQPGRLPSGRRSRGGSPFVHPRSLCAAPPGEGQGHEVSLHLWSFPKSDILRLGALAAEGSRSCDVTKNTAGRQPGARCHSPGASRSRGGYQLGFPPRSCLFRVNFLVRTRRRLRVRKTDRLCWSPVPSWACLNREGRGACGPLPASHGHLGDPERARVPFLLYIFPQGLSTDGKD